MKPKGDHAGKGIKKRKKRVLNSIRDRGRLLLFFLGGGAEVNKTCSPQRSKKWGKKDKSLQLDYGGRT